MQLLFYLKNITSIIKDDIEGAEKNNSSKKYAAFLENMKKTGIYNPLIDK